MEVSETVSEIELGYVHCLQGGFDLTMCVTTAAQCTCTSRPCSSMYQRINSFIEFDLVPMPPNVNISPESTSCYSDSEEAKSKKEMLQLTVPVYYRLASHSDADPYTSSSSDDTMPLVYEILRRPRAFAFIGRCEEERNNHLTVSQRILASLLARLRAFFR